MIILIEKDKWMQKTFLKLPWNTAVRLGFVCHKEILLLQYQDFGVEFSDIYV